MVNQSIAGASGSAHHAHHAHRTAASRSAWVRRKIGMRACALLLGLFASACTLLPLSSAPSSRRSEIVLASTTRNELIRFNAGQPATVLSRLALTGMQPDERLAGIDFRPANGKLYGIGTTLRLYTIDTSTGRATQVGSAPLALRLLGTEFGFDFNPVVDRIRLVTDKGENLRVHPDTGALVDSDAARSGVQIDGPLRYDEEDQNGGRLPRISAAAYTNGVMGAAPGAPDAPKTTTNFAIDAILGALVTLGTRERSSPAFAPATPNTGLLFTVGTLGVQPDGPVSFDIASAAPGAPGTPGAAQSGHKTGVAFAAFIPLGKNAATLYQVNLETGAATALGVIDRGEPVTGIAIQP